MSDHIIAIKITGYGNFDPFEAGHGAWVDGANVLVVVVVVESMFVVDEDSLGMSVATV